MIDVGAETVRDVPMTTSSVAKINVTAQLVILTEAHDLPKHSKFEIMFRYDGGMAGKKGACNLRLSQGCQRLVSSRILQSRSAC